MRTHVSLPRELIAEIDEIAGPRKRSEFIEEAVRQKLLNERQKRALRRAAELPGLDPEKFPYWATPEKVSQWVRESRQRDNERLEQKLRRLTQ
jgi:hypothetical protein